MSAKSGKPTALPRKTSRKTKQDSPHHDWLAEFATKAGLDDKGLLSVRDWIAEQFIGDEYAQLGHAGHGDTQVPLQQVFVDLPMGMHPSITSDRPGETRPFLQELLAFDASPLRNFCDNRFFDRNDAESNQPLQTSPPVARNKGPMRSPPLRRNDASLDNCNAAGTILIGGPGQGKSTLCQLLCQLHRFPLVVGDPRPHTTAVKDVLTPFQAVDPNSKLTPPVQPLLPIRIVLPDASTWLEKSTAAREVSDIPILLKFISSQKSSEKAQLAAPTLAALMAHIPFLLVFDGFDEIGAESDRKRIIEAIRELIAKFATQSSKAVIVATTRPQGYTGELEGIGVRLTTRYLVRLSTKEALHYAFKLLDAKIKGVDEREKRKDQLRAAAEEPATAKLLETPLQATILAALSEKGNVPTQRWRLFEYYLGTMYDREIRRSIGASKLLEQRQSQIKSIHARAALLLQVEAEAAGGAASKMPRTRFTSIVDQVLKEEGVDEGRGEIVENIVKVAENRLVLLVTPEPDFFGFEIRSLQEFMAAWALAVDVKDSLVEHRIWQIAKAPLFRNVLLFIASKIYGGTSSLREYIAKSACVKLNEDASDELAQTTKAGALLALEILEEGAVSSSTRFARELMLRAAGLLDLPASELHPRLVRAVNKDTEKVFIEGLEKRITSESFLDSVTSWVCLLEAINTKLGKNADKPNDPSLAERLADAHWSKVRDPNAILEACRYADIDPSEWLVAKINETPEAFDPYWLTIQFHFGRRKAEKPLAWRLHGKAAVVAKAIIGFEQRIMRTAVMGHLLRISSLVDQKSKKQDLESVRELSPQWRAWTSVIEFEEHPSAAQLATTLSEIALNLPPTEWRKIGHRVSWPLQACLQAATAVEDLEAMANAAERLELGDHNDWTVAESKWIERPTIHQELIAAQNAKPFTRDSIRLGPPIFCFQTTTFYGFTRPPPHVSITEWLQVFEGLSRIKVDPPNATLLSGIIDAQLAAPDSPGWIHLLMVHVGRGDFVKPSLRAQLATSLASQSYPQPETRLQVALLRLWLGELPVAEIDAVLTECAKHREDDLLTAVDICSVLTLSAYPRTIREQVLVQWYSLVQDNGVAAYQAMWRLRREFHVRRSDLNNLTTWNQLDLPQPYPQARTTELASSPIPTKPIVLEKLHLQHVRGIHDLILEFSAPPDGKGQWIVFLGRNGMGKTTLLKALCIALRNLDDAKIWGDKVWTPPWREFNQDAAARIAVNIVGFEQQVTTIHNGSQRHRQTPPHAEPRLFPLFAYGCRRGSALGSEGKAVDPKNEESGPEIATLFDEGAGLVHAETWLKDWKLNALEDPQDAKPIYDAVVNALRTLLVIDDIFTEDRQVYVKEKSGRTIPFSAMSDGYLTTASWFLDLIARWIELCKRAGYNVGSEFLSQMRGLVLIDEIDLHLHPSWQVEVIRRTRELMPKMSFIVTTHNPLTLVGAKPEEIFKLKERDRRIVAERGQALPILLTSSEIFSHYFDVDDVLPEGLGQKLQRYEFLSRYSLRNEAEQKEMVALKADLAKEGIVPNWPEAEQIVVPPENAPATKAKTSRRRKAT